MNFLAILGEEKAEPENIICTRSAKPAKAEVRKSATSLERTLLRPNRRIIAITAETNLDIKKMARKMPNWITIIKPSNLEAGYAEDVTLV